MAGMIELKRGDSRIITLSIPKLLHTQTARVYFMAKPEFDDDKTDARAVIAKELESSAAVVSGESVVYRMDIKPADTNSIVFNGEPYLDYVGELEVRDGDAVHSFPSGKKGLKVRIYPDVRRGGA